MQQDAKIELVPYDPQWPRLFAVERTLLESIFAPWLVADIEHIGSTAVPNLAAKPVIDIMAPVRSLHESLAAIDVAAQADYLYAPYKADLMHWFCKPSPAQRTHHLHLVPYESRLWFERLAFRDALRSNPELAAEYFKLKQQLAAQFTTDRDAYTNGKSAFVQRVLLQFLDARKHHS